MDGYKQLLQRVNARKRLATAIRLVDYFSVCITAMVYIFLLVASLFGDDLRLILNILLIPGIPFVLVSLSRGIIDAKRPYEVYDIYEMPPKNKSGCSFPSRHAFSAFSIGTLALRFLPAAGASVLFCGVLLSVSRVLLGKHFPRDVIAGALIGIATSVLGMLPIILI